MKDYILTIKVPIEAIDDVEARNALGKKFNFDVFNEADEIKLQEVFKNKPPRKVNLE